MPTLNDTLRSLIGEPTGDREADLVAAADVVSKRRQRNIDDGALIIAALRHELGWTWERIGRITGIPRTTAQRWLNEAQSP